MKRRNATFFAGLLLCGTTTFGADNIITLDLSKANPPLQFDSITGAWKGTFDDDAEKINSQCFAFVHNSYGKYGTWWGFTASNSTDNTFHSETSTYQYSNMAKGGIVLDENGHVVTDENGAVIVSGDMPYLIGYGSGMWGPKSIEMGFNDGKTYIPCGVYVNLTTWPYYCIENGDAMCRPFHNGDRYTFSVVGVGPNNTERNVEVALASFDNGDLTINRDWKYVDLSPLGEVKTLYFNIDTTDKGTYGMNTPTYFALDKLSVKPSGNTSVALCKEPKTVIEYDKKSHKIKLHGAEFAIVYDASGQKILQGEGENISLEELSEGIYLVRAGDRYLKVLR